MDYSEERKQMERDVRTVTKGCGFGALIVAILIALLVLIVDKV